ncbi:hypothetical protein BGZ47_004731 [Haplosporangium gracile]|nr:hypothetical protein BGZ47_004731 [Haplosporangium gracile]
MSISNGDSWTIPENALGRCSEDKLYVQFTGQMYDLIHLAHILPYWESCGALFVAPAPPKPTTTTRPPPTVPPIQPPTQQPPTTTTRDPTVPTEVPPITTNPPTQQPPTSATTTSYSPVYTTTYTLVPTVISGTSTVISVTTVIVVTPTALPSALTLPGSSTDGSVIAPPDNSQLPGLPPSPGGNNNNSSNKSGSNTNVPAAALGAVGGVAALALIVFGLVVTRRRRRIREEQEAASAGLGSKDDYYYDGASSLGGPDAALAASGAAGAGAAYAAAGAGRHSSDDKSMPSLHHTYPPVHPPTDGSESYGWDFNTSYAAAGTSAAADADPILMPFPVPATTSDALKQQYDLANRLSVISQVDSMLGFPLVPKTSPPQAPASATAAYALNQQMSLKQQLDSEDDAAFTSTSPIAEGGESPELYYLPISDSSPSQAFLSARGSPGTTTASAVGGADGGATTTRSSAYETVHSSSSAYATADSPSWSAASLQSHDIAIPMPPTTSGGGGQHNIQDLIRDVLRDD